ncbi:sperm axonemal maintenance protein CFAP97D1 [Halichoeres trimaculatus]|uniref:sperm axonemal maintenance protein CFAP97D1 n=1 Tax=Halichoeres trimaculatus TaxID=147232 RepID=UPI003D9E38EB
MDSGDSKPTGGPRSARTIRSHQGYQPLLPSANRYLQHKWDKASYDLHREKVKSAKSQLNITPPKIYPHVSLGLKKQKLAEERTLKIQRENTLLWNKITLIAMTSGAVDNWNHYTKKSLSMERRQQEQLHIQKENLKTHQRLICCRSHYDVRGWQKDWRKHLKLMDRVALYPRGYSSLLKGQDKPMKKPSGWDKEQNDREDAAAHSAESNKEKQEKPEENTEKELGEAANPIKETQPDTAANPTEHAPSSDNNKVTDETHCAETSASSDGCAGSVEG